MVWSVCGIVGCGEVVAIAFFSSLFSIPLRRGLPSLARVIFCDRGDADAPRRPGQDACHTSNESRRFSEHEYEPPRSWYSPEGLDFWEIYRPLLGLGGVANEGIRESVIYTSVPDFPTQNTVLKNVFPRYRDIHVPSTISNTVPIFDRVNSSTAGPIR